MGGALAGFRLPRAETKHWLSMRLDGIQPLSREECPLRLVPEPQGNNLQENSTKLDYDRTGC